MKRERYDAVVIGSGVGGMCAAARLAHAGYKTLVVEKLPQMGGRCATLKYKGFTLSTGAMTIAMDGPMGDTFKDVGVEQPVRLIPPEPVVYRIDHEDREPPKPGLKGIIAMVSKDEKEVERVWSAIQRAITWQAPLPGISLRDWLSQYTQNRLIWEAFERLTREHHGVLLPDLPAAEYIEYSKAPAVYYKRSMAPEGNTAMWEALVGMMREKGSNVWTRCGAKRILVEDQVIKGVIVEKQGEELEIEAKAVISNAGPKETVELAGKENFDKGYLKAVREVPGVDPYMGVFIAADRLIYTPDRQRLMFTRSRVLLSIRHLSLVCPEWAPPGKYLYFCGATFPSLPPLDLRKQADFCLQDLWEIFPGAEKYTEILKLSTYYGDDWPFIRSRPGYDLPQKTPVENLYNVGDGVKPPGWVATTAAAESARIVVEDVKQRFKPGEA